MNGFVEEMVARLREAMETADDGKPISARRLAELSDISHVTIGKILSGKIKNPRIETVMRLAESLGAHPRAPLRKYSPDGIASAVGLQLEDFVRGGQFELRLGGIAQRGPFWPPSQHPKFSFPIDFPKDSSFRNHHQVAFEIKGDELAEAGMPEGSYVRVVSITPPELELKRGMYVLTKRTRESESLEETAVYQLDVQDGKFGILVWRRYESRTFEAYELGNPRLKIAGLVTAAFIDLKKAWK